MAVKNIAVTDTLETFRTTFNDLAANDFGDISTLSGAISATNLVGAMNETISIATSSAGFTIEDSSSTQQIVGGGDILRVFGTSNEIEAVVSATDTLTIGLPASVTVTTQLTSPTVVAGNLTLTNGSITDSSGQISFGNENLVTTGTINGGAITGTSITGSGATHTLGTIEISGNTIRSTDSTTIIINDALTVNNPLISGVTTINPTGTSNITNIKFIWYRIKDIVWRWCLKMGLNHVSKSPVIQQLRQHSRNDNGYGGRSSRPDCLSVFTKS